MPCSPSLAIRLLTVLVIIFLTPGLAAQDASTGAIRGSVLDPEGRPISAATVAVVNASTGARHSALSDDDGHFVVELLPPGDYSARAEIKGMSPQVTPQIHVDATWSTALTITMLSSVRREDGTAHRTSSPMRSFKSSGFRRIPMERNWDALAERS